MLVAERIADLRRFEAWQAERSDRFRCPDCQKDVTLRKGAIRIHHFAHRPPILCVAARRETMAHLEAKAIVASALRARGLAVEVEKPVLSAAGDRRADLLVRHPRRDLCIALELQHTTISLDAISARTRAYMAIDAAVVWIPILRPERVAGAYRVGGAPFAHVERFSATPWERWIAAYQFGHLWYLLLADRTLWRGWFSPHKVYEMDREWREDGEERHAGGFWRPSKRYRELDLEGPYAIDDIRIAIGRREDSRAGPFTLPAGPLARLIAPPDDPRHGPDRPPLRKAFYVDSRNGQTYERLEIRIDGAWKPAALTPCEELRRKRA